mgnify:CR=1 FL=1
MYTWFPVPPGFEVRSRSVFSPLSRSAANRVSERAMSSRIRPKAWLSHHRPGTGSFKYHFNVHVHDVVLREGMVVPEGAKFRLVWKRGDKVASQTDILDPRANTG